MNPRHVTQFGRPTSKPLALYDKWLILAVVSLVMIGLMMVASSSVMLSVKHHHQSFHFLIRQASYLSLGLIAAMVVMRLDTKLLEKYSTLLLLGCIVLLAMVLIPGIGRMVNGSRRWIALGPIGVQVSELAKLGMVLYLAGYMVRHKDKIQDSFFGFAVPMVVLGLVTVLLLLEPDFGVLQNPVAEYVREVILIGEDADKLEESLKEVVTLERASSLEQAAHIAKEKAKPGDVVLFSPACASFDMFENFEHRGDVFCELVEAL